jgi:hypothetical protein
MSDSGCITIFAGLVVVVGGFSRVCHRDVDDMAYHRKSCVGFTNECVEGICPKAQDAITRG